MEGLILRRSFRIFRYSSFSSRETRKRIETSHWLLILVLLPGFR